MDSEQTKAFQLIGVSALGLLAVFGAFSAGAVTESSVSKGGSPSMLASVVSAIVPAATVSATLAIATDTPAAGTTIQASASSQTNGVTLSSFSITPKGADTTLRTLVVAISAKPTATTSAAVIHTLKLYEGSTLLENVTLSVSSSTMSQFSNLNVSIPANTTQNFHIVADINPLDGKAFVNGASVQVTVPGAGIYLETLGAACTVKSVAITGDAVGNSIAFQNAGITVDASPTTSATTATVGSTSQQLGTFSFTFNVTALGQDAYVPSSVNAFAPLQLFDQNGIATTTQATSITSTADRTSQNNYVIHVGQTKSFTITLTKLGQNGTVQAKLATLRYGNADQNPANNTYSFPSTYVTNLLMVKGVTTVSTSAKSGLNSK